VLVHIFEIFYLAMIRDPLNITFLLNTHALPFVDLVRSSGAQGLRLPASISPQAEAPTERAPNGYPRRTTGRTSNWRGWCRSVRSTPQAGPPLQAASGAGAGLGAPTERAPNGYPRRTAGCTSHWRGWCRSVRSTPQAGAAGRRRPRPWPRACQQRPSPPRVAGTLRP
jgi:hypothetical protein